MSVRVFHVNIPALSTVGTAAGHDVETGKLVKFAGDHRPLREIGEVIEQATDDDDLPVVEVEEWQVLEVTSA